MENRLLLTQHNTRIHTVYTDKTEIDEELRLQADGAMREAIAAGTASRGYYDAELIAASGKSLDTEILIA